MLRRFAVSNFKCFENEFVLDFAHPNGYTFNSECVRHGIVNAAMVYGYNGTGKSNLGLAIFDVIEHLTDKRRDESSYRNYLNASSRQKYASFSYEFQIGDTVVRYDYQKSSYKILEYESLSIDGQEVIWFDRRDGNDVFDVLLPGTENLNRVIGDMSLSVLKYIKNNSSLDDSKWNMAFKGFYSFVERMLFFRSLEDRTFIGLEISSTYLRDDIIASGLENFEAFLKEADLDFKLSLEDRGDKQEIMADFGEKRLPFFQIMSTGTSSLTLFYCWFQRLNKSLVSLLFIDEFDAFYHNKLSRKLIEMLKDSGVQFVVTTHNTSIMTNELLRPDCYYLINKKEIRPLSDCTDRELREVHNIEKIYKSGAFDNE